VSTAHTFTSTKPFFNRKLRIGSLKRSVSIFELLLGQLIHIIPVIFKNEFNSNTFFILGGTGAKKMDEIKRFRFWRIHHFYIGHIGKQLKIMIQRIYEKSSVTVFEPNFLPRGVPEYPALAIKMN